MIHEFDDYYQNHEIEIAGIINENDGNWDMKYFK